MLATILLSLAVLCALAFCFYLDRKQIHMQHRVANMAMKVAELEQMIDRVDKTVGKDIYDLRQQVREFTTNYGEAAIEAERETARAEKAWADGLNNIMSFGASFQGRGDAK